MQWVSWSALCHYVSLELIRASVKCCHVLRKCWWFDLAMLTMSPCSTVLTNPYKEKLLLKSSSGFKLN